MHKPHKKISTFDVSAQLYISLISSPTLGIDSSSRCKRQASLWRPFRCSWHQFPVACDIQTCPWLVLHMLPHTCYLRWACSFVLWWSPLLSRFAISEPMLISQLTLSLRTLVLQAPERISFLAHVFSELGSQYSWAFRWYFYILLGALFLSSTIIRLRSEQSHQLERLPLRRFSSVFSVSFKHPMSLTINIFTGSILHCLSLFIHVSETESILFISLICTVK